jgi:squalene cyclase
MRPPLGGLTDIHLTALTIRALTAYSPPGRQRDTNARIDRALEFLESAKPMDTQDEAFTLLGFKWADASAKDRAYQAKRLLALQRKDGGWGQLPTMDSDAYATGQALYALYLNGLPATDAAYRTGVEYLLRTQREDGTWFVRSRGFPFQPYFDTGFPGGKNQFISAAATSWATLALAFSL